MGLLLHVLRSLVVCRGCFKLVILILLFVDHWQDALANFYHTVIQLKKDTS